MYMCVYIYIYIYIYVCTYISRALLPPQIHPVVERIRSRSCIEEGGESARACVCLHAIIEVCLFMVLSGVHAIGYQPNNKSCVCLHVCVVACLFMRLSIAQVIVSEPIMCVSIVVCLLMSIVSIVYRSGYCFLTNNNYCLAPGAPWCRRRTR